MLPYPKMRPAAARSFRVGCNINDKVGYFIELKDVKNRYKYLQKKGIYPTYINKMDFKSLSDKDLSEIGYSTKWIEEYRNDQIIMLKKKLD